MNAFNQEESRLLIYIAPADIASLSATSRLSQQTLASIVVLFCLLILFIFTARQYVVCVALLLLLTPTHPRVIKPSEAEPGKNFGGFNVGALDVGGR